MFLSSQICLGSFVNLFSDRHNPFKFISFLNDLGKVEILLLKWLNSKKNDEATSTADTVIEEENINNETFRV